MAAKAGKMLDDLRIVIQSVGVGYEKYDCAMQFQRLLHTKKRKLAISENQAYNIKT